MYLRGLLVFGVLSAMCGGQDAIGPEQLSFVENVYITFSTACRALMDLQYSTPARNQKEIVKKMRIIFLKGNKIINLNIDEAFLALTNPSLYDITRQTKVIIHGFNDNAQSEKPFGIACAYNDTSKFNVLLVDAGEILKDKYLQSVHYTRLLGRRLANLLANLENFGTSASDMHIVGISLGAHVAGWTGKYFKRYKERRIGRITGLDPAGPCFTYAEGEVRLHSDDADYVDVVHVNRLVQGVLEPVGHADYYVNGGGPHQPGCLSPSCSHQRAASLYEESVRAPKCLIGVKCDSWKAFEANACDSSNLSVMGYGSSASSRGVYYLRTASGSPYGLAMRGISPAQNYMQSLLRAFRN